LTGAAFRSTNAPAPRRRRFARARELATKLAALLRAAPDWLVNSHGAPESIECSRASSAWPDRSGDSIGARRYESDVASLEKLIGRIWRSGARTQFNRVFVQHAAFRVVISRSTANPSRR
jgi:hypothetical protein